MEYLGTFFLYTSIIFIVPVLTEKAILSKRSLSRKVYTIIVILVCCILAACRGNTGTDTRMYRTAYEIISKGLDYNNRWVDFESGYVWLNRALGYFRMPFEVLMFVCQFITIGFVFLAIKQMKEEIDVKLAMFIYMSIGYFTSYNMVRQAIAIAICLYAFSLLIDKPIYLFALWVLVASLFHRSALICLGIAFIKFILQNKKMIIVQVVGVILAIYLVFHKEMIGDIVYRIYKEAYYAAYFSRDTDASGNLTGFFIQNFPYFVLLVLGYKEIWDKNNKKFMIYFWTVIGGYCLLMLGKITRTQVHRVAYYFTYLGMLLFAGICRGNMYIGGKKVSSQLCYYALEIFLIVIFYYNCFLRQYSSLIPYRGI